MKMLSALAALMLGTTAAVAGPFGLPDHQPNGYRDTGCDPAQQRQITNADGEYLYSNNPTCPMVGGPSDAEIAAAAAVEEPEEEDPEEEIEVAKK
ncbi:hypothetical protein [Microcystis phage Mel-JY03]